MRGLADPESRIYSILNKVGLISTTLYSRVFDQLEGVPPRVPKL